ncbi:MAG: orotidine-5'-phosphate decarboxylase [Anaerolineae bacterium]
MPTFWEKLAARARRADSLLCVGLDPHPGRRPERYATEAAFLTDVVRATAPYAAAFKPNLAFYEAMGPAGAETLAAVLRVIPPEIPVILDAKRSDIASTAAAYAKAAYEVWEADAVTVNPYLGADGIAPFAGYEDRGVFLLCRTSNPSAGELQDWDHHGQSLYLRVAELAQGRWFAGKPYGLVAGATYPESIAAIRRAAPDAWLLVPGVGAQGGEILATLRAGLRADGIGVLINASRSICYAEDPAEAARDLRERINAARFAAIAAREAPSLEQSSRDDLARALYETGCVRFGEFRLHSGALSPVYIDLRRLVSHPAVLERVAAVYAELLAPLSYDRIAALPFAALPIGTAVSLRTGQPLIYPRPSRKDYGTGQLIEGAYQAGERAVILDDLITTGGSKLEALAPLRDEGLVVEDVVVLLDREQGGRADLEAQGIRLHAALTLRGVTESLERQGRISPEQAMRVRDYLATA